MLPKYIKRVKIDFPLREHRLTDLFMEADLIPASY